MKVFKNVEREWAVKRTVVSTAFDCFLPILLSFHGVHVDSHAREIRDALALAMGRPLRKCSRSGWSWSQYDNRRLKGSGKEPTATTLRGYAYGCEDGCRQAIEARAHQVSTPSSSENRPVLDTLNYERLILPDVRSSTNVILSKNHEHTTTDQMNAAITWLRRDGAH